jgi:hypothetical protein
MQFKPTSLVVLALVLFTTGCRREFPRADNGRVERYDLPLEHGRLVTAALSTDQINALTKWHRDNATEWEHRIADVPPGILVVLKRNQRVVAGINIGPSFVSVNSWYHPLTGESRSELLAILNVANALGTGATRLPDALLAPARF